MELVQIYFEKFNKLSIITNFLAFSFYYYLKNFLLDPDPGEKMKADPCGSGSIALIHMSCTVVGGSWRSGGRSAQLRRS